MKATLIRKAGIPFAIRVGRFCFEIVNEQVINDPDQKAGGIYKNPEEKQSYQEAFDYAELVWEHGAGVKDYDAVEDH